MIYLGIDPGKSGAVAYMMESEHGWVTNVMKIADLLPLVAKIAKVGQPIRCCLERVHAMPKQGVTSTFSFGENYGYIKGVLETMRVSYQEVPPERWKREFGLNTDKKKSIEVCKKLFPDADLRPSDRSRVDNDGMAEALLMAEYARRRL